VVGVAGQANAAFRAGVLRQIAEDRHRETVASREPAPNPAQRDRGRRGSCGRCGRIELNWSSLRQKESLNSESMRVSFVRCSSSVPAQPLPGEESHDDNAKPSS
jgi:hypothetical protein